MTTELTRVLAKLLEDFFWPLFSRKTMAGVATTFQNTEFTSRICYIAEKKGFDN